MSPERPDADVLLWEVTGDAYPSSEAIEAALAHETEGSAISREDFLHTRGADARLLLVIITMSAEALVRGGAAAGPRADAQRAPVT